MNRSKAVTTVTALLLSALLAGCGNNTAEPEPTPSTTQSENPQLSVFDTPTPERINFTLTPGKLTAGTKVQVSAYNGGFENAAPGCNGTATTSTTVNVNSSGEATGSLSAPGVGNVRLVMTAPGYASSCDGTENTITVKWAPNLTIDATDKRPGAQPIKTPKVGETFSLAVLADIVSQSTFTDNFFAPMVIQAHGPYTNLPELQAAGCPEDAPIAASTTTELNYAKAGTGKTPPLELSLNEPGAYWLSVAVDETERSLEAVTNACEGDVSTAVVIVQ